MVNSDVPVDGLMYANDSANRFSLLYANGCRNVADEI